MKRAALELTTATKRGVNKVKDYIAWLNSASVMRGTLTQVRKRAIEIYNTNRWAAFNGHKPTILRITRGVRQLFVSSEELPPIEPKGSIEP